MTILTEDPGTGSARPHHGHLVGLRAAAVPAWRTLVAALVSLDTLGISTPCAEDAEAFTHDDAGIRFIAAKACGLCPVRTFCGAFAVANRERDHVWGGRDQTSGARRHDRDSQSGRLPNGEAEPTFTSGGGPAVSPLTPQTGRSVQTCDTSRVHHRGPCCDHCNHPPRSTT